MNSKPLQLILAACTAALALTLAGCGSDAGQSAENPSVSDYVAEVGPICTQMHADIDAISAKFEATPTEDQFKEGLVQGSERFLTGIEALTAVTPPEETAEQVSAWLAAFTQEVEKLPNYTVAQAQQGIDAFAVSDPLAQDLGLGICSSDGK